MMIAAISPIGIRSLQRIAQAPTELDEKIVRPSPVGVGSAPSALVESPALEASPAMFLRQRIEEVQVSLNANVINPTDGSLEQVRQSFSGLRAALQSTAVKRSDETRLVNAFLDYAQLAEQECNEIILDIEKRQQECAILDELLQLIRTKGDKGVELKDDPVAMRLIERARELGVKIEGTGWKDSKGKEVWMENIKAVRSQLLATNDVQHIKLKRATSLYERGMMTATSLLKVFDDICRHIIRSMSN
jgi:hypothetical protein